MKTAKPIFALSASLFTSAILLCAAEGVLFQDDFKTGAGWDLGSDAAAKITDGKLIVETAPGKSDDLLFNGQMFQDMSASINVQILSGGSESSGGLHFWAKDYSDMCVALIYANGFMEVYRWANQKRSYLSEATEYSAIKKGLGEINLLKVTTRGDQATISVNGKDVLTVKGEPPAGGSKIGVRASAPKMIKTACAFSDLKVIK